jgi:hypothetical protein
MVGNPEVITTANASPVIFKLLTFALDAFFVQRFHLALDPVLVQAGVRVLKP